MSEFKETVTTSKDQTVGQAGAEIQQKTKRVDTSVKADSKTTASNFVWYILGVIEILIGFRFVLKLLGANPDNSFVNSIYNASGVLTAPFDSIFNVSTSKSGDVRSVFEPSILVAAAVYLLIAWGIVKLINLNRTA